MGEGVVPVHPLVEISDKPTLLLQEGLQEMMITVHMDGDEGAPGQGQGVTGNFGNNGFLQRTFSAEHCFNSALFRQCTISTGQCVCCLPGSELIDTHLFIYTNIYIYINIQNNTHL